jgi:hypothetical protein
VVALAAFWVATIAAARPASATLAADGRYDVAVLNESSPDAAFWQESNLASVMGTAPGVAPFRLTYISVAGLTPAVLVNYDVLVIATNLRWFTSTQGITPTLAAFVHQGGVLVVAPGAYLDSALSADPLVRGFGTGYDLTWAVGDTVDTGCNSGGTKYPAKQLVAPTPLDALLTTPNSAGPVLTDCDHILLTKAGTAFKAVGGATQYTVTGSHPLRLELAVATYGLGKVIASTTSFSHNTLQDQQLAENFIITAQVPAGAPPPDTVPPAVTLNPPPTIVANGAISVTGSAQDAGGVASVVVLVNGVQQAAPVPSPSGGAFQASLTLTEGVNVVVVRATDVAGNTSQAQSSVTLDTTAPDVRVTSTIVLTNQPAYTLTGAVADRGAGLASVRLEANTVSFANPTPTASGTVSGVATLVEGLNTLEVEANDLAGNYARDQILVTLDTVPPSARLLSVPSLTNQAALTITGSASDAHGVAGTKIFVNGALVGAPTPAPDGTVTAAGTLVEGVNTVLLQVTDAAGNVSADQVDVVLDDVAPAITIATPLANQAFGSSTVPLVLTVADASATARPTTSRAAAASSRWRCRSSRGRTSSRSRSPTRSAT